MPKKQDKTFCSLKSNWKKFQTTLNKQKYLKNRLTMVKYQILLGFMIKSHEIFKKIWKKIPSTSFSDSQKECWKTRYWRFFFDFFKTDWLVFLNKPLLLSKPSCTYVETSNVSSFVFPQKILKYKLLKQWKIWRNHFH